MEKSSSGRKPALRRPLSRLLPRQARQRRCVRIPVNASRSEPMYRHLMVPLDDSPLSVESIRHAVDLARALGAKVSFFHAKADYGGTSVGALERVIAPATFNENVAGEARAILAKAEVVAREAGVAYDSVIAASDRPHEAILDAAEARGCDLIFMASHGRRGIKGLMLGSETQKVLQHTTIPVLVSAVESNIAPPAYLVSATIIRDEHRSLAAVIHGLEYLVREARAKTITPQFVLLRAMLHYIKAFPETFITRRRRRIFLGSCASARTNTTTRSA